MNESSKSENLIFASNARKFSCFILELIVLFIIVCGIAILAALLIGIPSHWDNTEYNDFGVFVGNNLFKFLVGSLSFYYFISWSFSSQTKIDKLLKIMVVDYKNQSPLDKKQAFIRTVVFIISIILLGLPFITSFLNNNKRSLHDLIAGTVVIIPNT